MGFVFKQLKSLLGVCIFCLLLLAILAVSGLESKDTLLSLAGGSIKLHKTHGTTWSWQDLYRPIPKSDSSLFISRPPVRDLHVFSAGAR